MNSTFDRYAVNNDEDAETTSKQLVMEYGDTSYDEDESGDEDDLVEDGNNVSTSSPVRSELRAWNYTQGQDVQVADDAAAVVGLFGNIPSIYSIFTYGSGPGKSYLAPFRTLQSWQVWAEKNVILLFIDTCLRSIGQVCFQNSPLTGLVFIIAMLSSKIKSISLLMVLCVAYANLFAIAFKLDRGLRMNGIFGYNAALIGCAFSTFFWSQEVGPTVGATFAALFVALPLLSALSVVIVNVVAYFFVPIGLTPLTFPFQLVGWGWLLASRDWYNVDQPKLPPSFLPVNQEIQFQWDYDVTEVVKAVFSGVAEIFVAADWWTGLIILFGIFLCSPISSFNCFLGSTVGTLFAVMVGVTRPRLDLGLYGYNSALLGISCGGFFLLAQGWRCGVLTFSFMIFCVVVFSAFSNFFAPMGIVALTFPFTVLTWIAIVLSKSVPDIVSVKLDTLTTPEDHIDRFLVTSRIISKFSSLQRAKDIFACVSMSELVYAESVFVPIVACQAASRGDMSELKRLLKDKNNINLPDSNKRRALHIACAEGNYTVCSFILKNGGDLHINARDKFGGTCLEDYIRFCMRNQTYDEKFFALLFKYQAELNLKSTSLPLGSTMCYLASLGDVVSIRNFLRAGVPYNTVDHNGRTAAHISAGGFRSVVDCAILNCIFEASGANILGIKDVFGRTPLDEARLFKFDKGINLLEEVSTSNIGMQARLQNRKKKQKNVSISAGALELKASVLLSSNAEWLATNLPEVLCKAIIHGALYDVAPPPKLQKVDDSVSVAVELRSFPAKPKPTVDDHDYLLPSMLFTQVVSGSVDEMEVFLKRAPKLINIQDYDKYTMLHTAVAIKRVDMVEFFIAKGCNLNTLDRWGNTPLWSAICLGDDGMITRLVSAGAKHMKEDVDVALYLAALAAQPAHFNLLRSAVNSKAVNISAADYDKVTALQVAVSSQNEPAIRLLVNAGASMPKVDKWGNTIGVKSTV